LSWKNEFFLKDIKKALSTLGIKTSSIIKRKTSWNKDIYTFKVDKKNKKRFLKAITVELPDAWEGVIPLHKTKEEWIDYLTEIENIPYIRKGMLVFKRLNKSKSQVALRMDERERRMTSRILDISSKEDCIELREDIVDRIKIKRFEQNKIN